MCGEQRARCTTRPCSPSTCPTTRRRRSALCSALLHHLHALSSPSFHSSSRCAPSPSATCGSRAASRCPPCRSHAATSIASAAMRTLIQCSICSMPPPGRRLHAAGMHARSPSRVSLSLMPYLSSSSSSSSSPPAHSFMVHADLRQKMADEGHTLDAVEAIVDELCARYQVTRPSPVAAPRRAAPRSSCSIYTRITQAGSGNRIHLLDYPYSTTYRWLPLLALLSPTTGSVAPTICPSVHSASCFMHWQHLMPSLHTLFYIKFRIY